jgi:hypothetical protein
VGSKAPLWHERSRCSALGRHPRWSRGEGGEVVKRKGERRGSQEARASLRPAPRAQFVAWPDSGLAWFRGESKSQGRIGRVHARAPLNPRVVFGPRGC